MVVKSGRNHSYAAFDSECMADKPGGSYKITGVIEGSRQDLVLVAVREKNE